jgi:hypothetical protein
MILFKTLSAINFLLCIACVWRMIYILRRYDIPRVWETFFYWKFCTTLLIGAVQFWTIFLSTPYYWPTKLWATAFAVMVFYFCRAIIVESKKMTLRSKLTEVFKTYFSLDDETRNTDEARHLRDEMLILLQQINKLNPARAIDINLFNINA